MSYIGNADKLVDAVLRYCEAVEDAEHKCEFLQDTRKKMLDIARAMEEQELVDRAVVFKYKRGLGFLEDGHEEVLCVVEPDLFDYMTRLGQGLGFGDKPGKGGNP